MIIDIHNHADYHSYSYERFVANMDENGIDISCMLSWEAPRDDYDPATKSFLSALSEDPVPFERCLAYKEYAPERFLLGFCPDPRKPDAIARLKSAARQFEIAMCGEFKLRMMFDNPDAIRMFRCCAELELPVLVHIDYEFDNGGYPWPNWWYGGGVEALERALALCPQTNFIGHAPGFWANISGDGKHLTEPYPTGAVQSGGKIVAMLDQYPNLYCDISAGSGHNALNRDLNFAKKFLTTYQDRVMYGRDCFDSRHRDLLDGCGLPKDVLEKINCTNAARLLNMKSRPDIAAVAGKG